jgi:hypothetical protein
MNTAPDSEAWPCDWESHRIAQLRRSAARSFRDKLIWLEETTQFVKKLQAAKPKDGSGMSSTPKE